MKNPLIVIVGKSGSGKTTVVRALCDLLGWEEAVSVTTRASREGEVEGIAYDFVTEEEFDCLSDKGLFVEAVTFNGNAYGITKAELAERTERVTTLLVVEPEGADQVRKNFSGEILVVDLVVSEEARRERMIGRGDQPSKVDERIAHDEEYWPKVRDLVEYDLSWDNEEPGPLTSRLMELVEDLELFPKPRPGSKYAKNLSEK